MLRKIRDFFGGESMAIDLGTVNTCVFVPGKGVVLNEPSVVAINRHTGKIEKVGQEAKEIQGREPDYMKIVWPLIDGVINELNEAEGMLEKFIHMANGTLLRRPQIVIGVSSLTNEVQRRAVRQTAANASKAQEVFLVEQAMVAAIGAGLPYEKPVGSIIVDIGGGTTDIAVVSFYGMASKKSIPVAGNAMDDAIAGYVKEKYGVVISRAMAEEVKLKIGCAYDPGKETYRVIGSDDLTKAARAVDVTQEDVWMAVTEPINQIVEAIKEAEEQVGPQLLSDVVTNGIVLTGGAAQLPGLDKRVSTEMSTQDLTREVRIANESPFSVVHGIGKLLDDKKLLKRVKLPDKLQE